MLSENFTHTQSMKNVRKNITILICITLDNLLENIYACNFDSLPLSFIQPAQYYVNRHCRQKFIYRSGSTSKIPTLLYVIPLYLIVFIDVYDMLEIYSFMLRRLLVLFSKLYIFYNVIFLYCITGNCIYIYMYKLLTLSQCRWLPL